MLSPFSSRLIFIGLLALVPLATLLGWSSREIWGGMLLVGFIFIVGLLGAFDPQSPRVRLPRSLVLFLVLLTTATVTSTYRYASLVALLPYFAGVMLWILAQRYVIDARKLRAISWIMIGSGALVATHALTQVPALSNLEVGISSTFGWKNALAGFLTLVGPLAAAQLGAGSKRWPTVAAGISLTAMFAALFFTTSQAGWLALTAGVAAVGAGRWVIQRRWLSFAGLLAVAAVLAGVTMVFLLQLNNAQNPATGLATTSLEHLAWRVPASTDARLRYWETSAQIIAAFPLLGVGLGNFTTWYTHYFSEPWLYTISPHNYLIYLAATGGLATAAVFLWFLATRVRHAWHWLKHLKISPSEHAEEFLRLGWLAGVASLFIHGLLDVSLEVPGINVLWWLALGIGIPSAGATRAVTPTRKKNFLRLGATLGLVMVTFLVLLADNRYQRALAIAPALGRVQERLTLLAQSRQLMPLSANTAEALAAARWDAVLERVGNRQENMQQALTAAQRAVELDPASAHRQWFLGRVYFLTMTRQRPAWPQVLYHLEQAIRYDFHEPAYYRTLAEAYLRLGWSRQARETIDAALTLYPLDQLGKIFAGAAVYEQLGLKEKLEELRRLRQLIPME